ALAATCSRDVRGRVALRRLRFGATEVALAGAPPVAFAVAPGRGQASVVDECEPTPVRGPARILAGRQPTSPRAVGADDVDRERAAGARCPWKANRLPVRRELAGGRPDGAAIAYTPYPPPTHPTPAPHHT